MQRALALYIRHSPLFIPLYEQLTPNTESFSPSSSDGVRPIHPQRKVINSPYQDPSTHDYRSGLVGAHRQLTGVTEQGVSRRGGGRGGGV